MENEKSKSITGLKIFLSAICLLTLLSIIFQDYSGYIPSTIFNTGKTIYYISSILSLMFFIFLFGIIIVTRKQRALFFVLTIFITFCVSELITRFVDYLIIDRPNGKVGSFYNNGSIILRKNGQLNSSTKNDMGFNETYNYTKEIPNDKLRIIFLGDSYTFGSGVPIGKSYPKIVENYLNTHSPRKFEVFNAGVPGYSPYDSYKLFKFLKMEGFKYDVIVLSIFLQNDFIEDIKNTYRKAIGGNYHRLPENIILRNFHPLNSYLFRYASNIPSLLLMYRLNKNNLQITKTTSNMINPVFYAHFQRNYLKKASHDFDKVYASLLGIKKESRSPFYIVIIPDQFYGDERIKRHILQKINKDDYDYKIYYQWINKRLRDFDILDITTVIHNCHGCYITNNTHLNDKGNLAAGNVVAKYLLTKDWAN